MKRIWMNGLAVALLAVFGAVGTVAQEPAVAADVATEAPAVLTAANVEALLQALPAVQRLLGGDNGTTMESAVTSEAFTATLKKYGLDAVTFAAQNTALMSALSALKLEENLEKLPEGMRGLLSEQLDALKAKVTPETLDVVKSKLPDIEKTLESVGAME